MDLVSVQSQIKANQYLSETVVQLEKDFAMTGIDFDINKPVSSYKSLFDFTFKLITTINQQEPKNILNLLYRIDLSEEFVQVQMKETEYSFTEMLSELIVKRELYKVILRKNRF